MKFTILPLIKCNKGVIVNIFNQLFYPFTFHPLYQIHKGYLKHFIFFIHFLVSLFQPPNQIDPKGCIYDCLKKITSELFGKLITRSTTSTSLLYCLGG